MFGKKLKEIRKSLSATQEGMAELLNVSVRSYTSYERNENNPPYSMLVVLCKEFDVNLNWLIADVGSMFRTAQFGTAKNELRHEVLQILKCEGIIK